MKNRYAIFFTALIFLSAGVANAQQESPTQEFLHWLPDVPYIVVLFDNDEALRTKDSYQVFRSKVAHRISGAVNVFLPASIAKNVRWYGYANTVRVRLSPGKEDTGDTDKLAQPIDVSNKGERLFVACCNLLAESITLDLESGELTETGERIDGSPVFSYRVTSKKEGHESRFGLVSADEYFVSANSMPMLRRMVATQRGEFVTILDSPDYEELQELLDNELSESHIWVATMMKMMQRTNEEIYRRSADATDQQIQTFRERQQQNPAITAVTFYVSDETIEECTIYGFVDEETAEAMAPVFSKTLVTVPEFDEYRALKDQVVKTTVRNVFVVTRTMYDQDIIAAFNKALETLENDSATPKPKK